MKLSDESVRRVADAVEHSISGHGPASVTVYHPGTSEPAVVAFLIPAPVGPLVGRFLSDLYMMLGWHTEQK